MFIALWRADRRAGTVDGWTALVATAAGVLLPHGGGEDAPLTVGKIVRGQKTPHANDDYGGGRTIKREEEEQEEGRGIIWGTLCSI